MDHLVEPFKSKAIQLIADCHAAGLKVLVIETLRSEEAHQEDLKTGHSWIARSKHQDGLAIDLCPFKGDELDWDASSQSYQHMGLIGESLGLIWGGRWKQRDMGHFEYGKG